MCSFRENVFLVVCESLGCYIQRVNSKSVWMFHSAIHHLLLYWKVEADDEKKELKTVILFDQGP